MSSTIKEMKLSDIEKEAVGGNMITQFTKNIRNSFMERCKSIKTKPYVKGVSTSITNPRKEDLEIPVSNIVSNDKIADSSSKGYINLNSVYNPFHSRTSLTLKVIFFFL